MSRFYLRLMLIPFVIFTAALLLIRVKPYDDHGLRQMMLADGCPAPCFMGIRPGVTTRDEAIVLLKASQWLEIEPSKLNGEDITFPLMLKWNGNQPALFYASEGVALTFQYTKPPKVSQIRFLLRNEITLGDVYLSLGKPSRLSRPTLMSPNTGASQEILIVSHQYDDDQIRLLTISNCPLNLSQLLQQPIADIEYDAVLRTDFLTSSLKEVLNYPYCG